MRACALCRSRNIRPGRMPFPRAWLTALALGAAAACGATEVPRWQVCDLSFRSTSPHANPFLVDFSAEVSGPGGVRFSQLGFYDGEGTWKIRLGPNALGRWSVRTHSSDPQLEGQAAEVTCVPQPNPRIHGGLLVDPDHPHAFIREDGTHFYYLGFECDWLWAVDLASCDPALPKTRVLLDRVADHGMKVILMNVYAHRGWSDQQPNYGPPARYPWGGSNDHPDYSVLNLAFWQHYDRVIRAMQERGIEAHVMIKVYNKHVHWPTNGSPEDDLYFRTVVARLSPFSNVHFDLAKESNREKSLAYKLGRMEWIRRHDPYRRLLTTHTDREDYPRYAGILDYRTAQDTETWRASTLRQRTSEPWPVVNAEFGYECGPGGVADTPHPVSQEAPVLFRRAWDVVMAGAYANYYYDYTSWNIVRVDADAPGYGYARDLARFFNGAGYWTMDPHDSLVDQGYCLADPGREYVVYEPKRAGFTLEVRGAARALPAAWYDPFTGRSVAAGRVGNGADRLEPPSTWPEGDPVVLHVGSPPEEAPVFRSTFERPLPRPWTASPSS